ncbi:MAG: hypothetical protein HYS86_00220 [Candidatus Chisholmbacteria bacterium]|nr:hypothetical protein [Candidatus Chisholmbacteria bacterium]
MKGHRKRQFWGQYGFTYLELLVGLGIVLTVIAFLVGMQVMLQQSYRFSFNLSATTDQANSVAADMVRALRGALPSETGAYPLEVLDDQQIVFYSDVDADGRTERVRFFLEGVELKRGIIEPTDFPVSYPTENETVKVLSDYVQNGAQPLFYYYNGAWPTDAVNNPLNVESRLSDTRFVQLFMTLNVDPTRPESNFNLSPYVQLRNLKENL